MLPRHQNPLNLFPLNYHRGAEPAQSESDMGRPEGWTEEHPIPHHSYSNISSSFPVTCQVDDVEDLTYCEHV